jgi:hypothetical protein
MVYIEKVADMSPRSSDDFTERNVTINHESRYLWEMKNGWEPAANRSFDRL